MIIDKKYKLFGLINIIDFFIILAFICAVGFVGYRLIPHNKQSTAAKTEDIEITFYGSEVPEYAASNAKSGELVRDQSKSNNLGSVKEIKILPSDSYATDSNGQWVKSPKPGYNSIYITVSAKGTFGDTGVTIGNSPYYTGNTLEIKVGKSAFWTRVYNIKKKE